MARCLDNRVAVTSRVMSAGKSFGPLLQDYNGSLKTRRRREAAISCSTNLLKAIAVRSRPLAVMAW